MFPTPSRPQPRCRCFQRSARLRGIRQCVRQGGQRGIIFFTPALCLRPFRSLLSERVAYLKEASHGIRNPNHKMPGPQSGDLEPGMQGMRQSREGAVPKRISPGTPLLGMLAPIRGAGGRKSGVRGEKPYRAFPLNPAPRTRASSCLK